MRFECDHKSTSDKRALSCTHYKSNVTKNVLEMLKSQIHFEKLCLGVDILYDNKNKLIKDNIFCVNKYVVKLSDYTICWWHNSKITLHDSRWLSFILLLLT